MTIKKQTRDRLLVEARHRCTICHEKCFEIHHIIEQSAGGSDEYDNLIVLCPNCHQHRYHRSKEFTPEQLHLYKMHLIEKNEIETRVLLNLEEIKSLIEQTPAEESETKLRQELNEALELVSDDQSQDFRQSIEQTSKWLAERNLLNKSAREALEIEWEIRRKQEKEQYKKISISKIDHDAYTKAPDFETAYTLVFILDSDPHPDWTEIFEHEHRNSYYNMKRRTTLEGNRITMIVSDQDNLQAHADYAKRLVEDTNKFIENHLFKDIDNQINVAKREALQQFDAITSLKERTKDIKL